MNEFLNELIDLWWIECRGELAKNPLSEKSIEGLKRVLREKYDFDSDVIEYIIESTVKTPTNFHLGGDRTSGIVVGRNDTAVSAHLHGDGDDDDEPGYVWEEEDESEEERPETGDDKEKAEKDIQRNALTALEKEKMQEVIEGLGVLLSEASIFDSKYSVGDRFLPLKATAELFSKGLPSGEKNPKGPFTKMGEMDDAVEVNIGSGPTVYVSADDTKKTYKITASANQFRSLFGKMRKGASPNNVNWNTEVLETAACMGLFVNGISILDTLSSAKTADELPKVVAKVKDKVVKALGSSGDYANAGEISKKLDNMPLGDWILLGQLMAGMTKFTDDILSFKPYLIHKSIKAYYTATERSDLVDGVKENTTDAVVSNVPGPELIANLEKGMPVEYDGKGVCTIKGTKIKFIQISLKKGKDSAQLGKIYSYLKDKYGLLSNNDVLDLAINEGFSDFVKRGMGFIRNIGTDFLSKLKQAGDMMLSMGKKIYSSLTKAPTKQVSDLEKQLQRAGMTGTIKEGILLGEGKASMWESFEEISKDQKLLDVIVKNTNNEFTKLKKAADKNPAFYYAGYKDLKVKAPVTKDNVAKLITNFQSAIVLQNMMGDLNADASKLYSQMVSLEKEMVYGKTTLPLYKVYGLSKDGGGTAYEPYPGSESYVEEKMNKDLSDVVVFYLYSSDQKTYFTLRAYGLSGINEKGDFKYSQFRMGTNDSGKYSYNFEGVKELPLGKVKQSLGIK